MIGYKNELERLQREKKDLTQNINDSKIKKEKEIMESQRLIEEKYNNIIEKNDRSLCETKGAIDFLKKKAIEFSEFKGAIAYEVVRAIIDIIRVSEGNEYIIQDINYPKNSDGSIYDTNKAYVIINKDRKLDENTIIHQLSEINIRVNEGNAIVLNWDVPNKNINHFKFYDLKDNNIKHNVNFGKFNYIKKFVDYIISYRLENGLKDITAKDIKQLEIMFLHDNIYEIQEFHKYLAEIEKEIAIKQAQEKAEHREKIFLRRINKNN